MTLRYRRVSMSASLRTGVLAVVVGGGVYAAVVGGECAASSGAECGERQPSRAVEVVDWPGDGVQLKGWWFHAPEKSRGTVVVLHGVADNRASSLGVADHFLARGFDVLASDSRAHGESTGNACTNGYYEKHESQSRARPPPGWTRNRSVWNLLSEGAVALGHRRRRFRSLDWRCGHRQLTASPPPCGTRLTNGWSSLPLKTAV